ncbi:cation:proton antiporter [Actinomadura terrae]|uniref:cation:proton antiporter n=1 Tax=Actinomadura terrae TaxID=604353 RepID=UPI001FA802A3|nr:cation:proton antiporter [Actinomadura terrae]
MLEPAAFLAAFATLIALANLFGALAARVGQPRVIGEILCGALLTGLAACLPHRPPDELAPLIDATAQLGLVIFLYGVGSELARSRATERASSVVKHVAGATVPPFGLGALLAVGLAPRHAPGSTASFVLFIAGAMSVTALPVLARILDDRSMTSSPAGTRALQAATFTDAIAWTMLAVIAATTTTGGHGGSPWRLVLGAPYLVIMFAVVRPLYRLHLRRGARQYTAVAIVCASSAATEWTGWHFALGALIAGLVLAPPSTADPGRREQAPLRLLRPVGALLMPLYFVRAGQQIDLSDVDVRLAGETVAVVIAAVAGKMGGCYLGARWSGQCPRAAMTFAALMNTRGLTEIVFLTIGLRLGAIDTGIYAAMIVMAMVTTAMTGVLLNRLPPGAPDAHLPVPSDHHPQENHGTNPEPGNFQA